MAESPADAFRLAFDAAPIGMALVDPDGHWVRVNPSLCALTGYSERELLDGRFQDITHPDDLEEDLEHVRQVLAAERSGYTLEKRYIRKDGHTVWVRLSVSLVRDASGAPIVFVSQIQDITEARQAEKALIAAESRRRLLIETLAEGVVVFDEEGRNVETNPAAARMIGMSADDAAGAGVGDRRWRTVREDGTDIPAEELPAEITRTTGIPQTDVVLGMRSPDGALRWLSVNTRVVGEDAGPPYRVVASFDDITNLKRAEHEARQRLAELQRAAGDEVTVLEALVAQSEIGLAFFDPDLRYVHVNDALASINGLPVEAHIGHTMLELFGDMAVETVRIIAAVRDGGVPLTDRELTGPPPWDTETFRVSFWPVHDSAGGLLGVSAMVLDITAEKAAERERERLLIRERQAAERLARLQQVTAALTAALTVTDVANVLVRAATAAVGVPRGWVALVAAERATLEWMADVGHDELDVTSFAQLPLDARSPGPDAIRAGRPQYFASAEEHAEAYPDLAETFRAAGNAAGAVVPIIGRDRPLGVIALASSAPHAFGEEDRGLLETIARLGAQALERARHYEREHATARILVESLLPAHLPAIPGVTLGHRYAPTPLLHSDVGGDFYDVIPVGEARWLLLVGDVAGKGPDAATLTGLVRHTLRAEARHESRPDELLSVLNEAILAQRTDGRFCTLACARIDLEDAPRGMLTLSAAGHPPPLLASPGGDVELLAAPGKLLGVFPGARYEATRVPFLPGSTLVLYTDGLLDARAPARELTAADLARSLGDDLPADPQTLVDRLYATAVGPGTVGPRDDIAILAARLTD